MNEEVLENKKYIQKMAQMLLGCSDLEELERLCSSGKGQKGC
jgi:hypothetical protein